MIESELLGLFCAALLGLADFLSRNPNKTFGYYLSATYVQLFGFVELVLIAVVFPEHSGQITENPLLFATLLAGLFLFAGQIALYRGFARGLMSITAPLVSAFPVATIALSALLLHEMISGLTAVCAAIVLAGIILASLNKTSEKIGAPVFVRGVESALIALLCFGAFYFILGFATPMLGPVIPIALVRGGAAVFSFLLLVPLKQRFAFPRSELIPLLVLIATLDSAGLLAFNVGISLNPGSLPVVSTLTSLASVIILLLARAFYSERLSKSQWIGVLLLVTGVAALLYVS